jgi:hypothetical protein
MRIKKSPDLDKTMNEASSILFLRKKAMKRMLIAFFIMRYAIQLPWRADEGTWTDIGRNDGNIPKSAHCRIRWESGSISPFRLLSLKISSIVLKHKEALRRLKGQEAFSDAAFGFKEI